MSRRPARKLSGTTVKTARYHATQERLGLVPLSVWVPQGLVTTLLAWLDEQRIAHYKGMLDHPKTAALMAARNLMRPDVVLSYADFARHHPKAVPVEGDLHPWVQEKYVEYVQLSNRYRELYMKALEVETSKDVDQRVATRARAEAFICGQQLKALEKLVAETLAMA